MSNEECEKVLKELYEVRPEKLNDKAKRLFEAIKNEDIETVVTKEMMESISYKVKEIKNEKI